jgi:hypothetical protein
LPFRRGWRIAYAVQLGPGEGLAEVLFTLEDEEEARKDPKTGKDVTRAVKVKRQTMTGGFIEADEGRTLNTLASRSGSTLLERLCTAWTGGPLGESNATEDRKRVVMPGTYTFGLILGLQTKNAGLILDDTINGTPQRFVWASRDIPTFGRHAYSDRFQRSEAA